jgi:alkanesulfonate monooxygenase SsuD/methylene tetrahydromethanopterin reductase-like flavin-dependent oxidoreductase (luciferase family)
VFLTDDAKTAADVAAGDFGERSIAGSTEHLVEQFGRYAELGFDEVIIPDFTLGSSPEERQDRYRELQSDVFAQLV